MECSPECQALKDFSAGMDPDELAGELQASGRFTDDDAALNVATLLTGGSEAPLEPVEGAPDGEEEPVEVDA